MKIRMTSCQNLSLPHRSIVRAFVVYFPRFLTATHPERRTGRKTAAITGGGTGIGYQVARAYAEAGANVALFYNTSAEAIDKAAGLEKEFSIKSKAYKVPGEIYRAIHPFRSWL